MRRAKPTRDPSRNAAVANVDYTVRAFTDGTYSLGPRGEYSLGAAALQHILVGDIAQRVIRTQTGFSHLQPVLRGGQHTVDGWLSFKKTLPGLKHGVGVFDPEAPWYWARELQNGVILLRVPREMYQKNAAELTRFADTYYKSGYLWKTLFPRDCNTPEIIRLINEALHHQDREESTPDVLVGYARVMDPLRAMKLRIQLTGSQINSGFPTWAQPATGNNGKPYTHSDSISFYTADSTEFFDDYDECKKVLEQTRLFNPRGAAIEDLVRSTPPYLLRRPAFSRTEIDVDRRSEWKKSLDEVGAALSRADAEALLRYLDDVAVRKVPFEIVRTIYSEPSVKTFSADWINAVDVYQNCADGLRVLCAFQSAAGADCTIAWDFIRTYLRTRFLQTGGMDLWQAKRMHTQIIRWVIGQGSGQLAWDYIGELANAPSRIALYTWFNLNMWAGFPVEIIGVDEPEVVVVPEMFYRFVGDTMGLNYVTTRTVRERVELARKLQENYTGAAERMVGDLVSTAESSDFVPSPCLLQELLPLLSATPERADEEILRLVSVDHFRMLLLAHHVIVHDNLDVFIKGEPRRFDQALDSPYGRYAKVKHLRMLLWAFYEQYSDVLVQIAQTMGMERLRVSAEAMKIGISRERIPLPKNIPDYIPHWSTGRKRSKRLSNERFAQMMLGGAGDVEPD